MEKQTSPENLSPGVAGSAGTQPAVRGTAQLLCWQLWATKQAPSPSLRLRLPPCSRAPQPQATALMSPGRPPFQSSAHAAARTVQAAAAGQPGVDYAKSAKLQMDTVREDPGAVSSKKQFGSLSSQSLPCLAASARRFLAVPSRACLPASPAASWTACQQRARHHGAAPACRPSRRARIFSTRCALLGAVGQSPATCCSPWALHMRA